MKYRISNQHDNSDSTKLLDTSEEVLKFDTNKDGWLSMMSNETDVTFGMANTSDTNDQFLGRPVKVATLVWEVGTSLHTTFDPWSLFFNNSKVVNRVAHFKNLRATLHVKFQLNGSPFYYGRLMASYAPLPKQDDVTIARASVNQDLIAASQRPKVFLDPNQSQGGQIECPFIFPRNTLSIPDSEWDQMGNITLFTLNPLQHANDVFDPITVTVYAWCSDYDLSTPTSRLPTTIVPQAGWSDEYGMVSGPAHTVANISGKLANVPFIGKFARATEIAASGVGQIASLFGFSRPRELEMVRSHVTGAIETAATNVPDNSVTLALDAKKEVTIDPTTTGASNIDEMAIVPLAMKESYVTTFGWNTSDFADTHLFSIRVRPTQGDVNGNEVHMTPSAWVSTLFEYWTGSMDFRFQVVCSAYHRGRLRIVWDPDYYEGNDYNVNYSKIIDIAHTKDDKLRIGWGQTVSYLPVSEEEVTDLFPSFSIGDVFTDVDPFANGTLSVYVVNQLTSPAPSGNEVYVNVFANATEDFEVAGPKGLFIDSLEFADASALNDVNFVTPDNPRNPGGNPTPDSGPIAAPQPADPTPPPPVTAPTLELVKKLVNPFPIVRGDYISSSQDFVEPQYSDLIGVAADRAMLITDDANDMLFWTRAGDEEINDTIIFNFSAAISGGAAINVTLDGTTVTGTIVGGIGDTVSISVPVTIPASTQPFITLPLTITTGYAGRTLLQSVQTFLYPFETVVRYSPADMEAQNVGSVVNNRYEAGLPALTFKGPANSSVGQPFALIVTDDIIVDGIPYTASDRVDTNALPVSGVWEGPDPAGRIDLAENNSVPIRIFDGYSVVGLEPEGEQFHDFSHIYPQADNPSDEIVEDHEDVNAPEISQPTDYIGPSCVCGPMNSVYFGEQVSSWRQVLKRFVSTAYFNSTSFNACVAFLPNYPISNIPLTTGAATYEPSGLNIFTYITSAYVCRRGSYRYKLVNGMVQFSGTEASNLYQAYATRVPNGTVTAPLIGDDTGTGTGDIFTFSGSACGFPFLNGAFEYEVPWYSNQRFDHARKGFVVGSESTDQYHLLAFSKASGATGMHLSAAGEDFMVTNFLSVPVFTFS